MRLTFLGTRGETAIRSRRHQRHSALLVEQDGARVMIDCGADWLHRLRAIAPTAVVLTHAHDDHAAGLVKVSGLCDCGDVEGASPSANPRPAYHPVAESGADWRYPILCNSG